MITRGFPIFIVMLKVDLPIWEVSNKSLNKSIFLTNNKDKESFLWYSLNTPSGFSLYQASYTLWQRASILKERIVIIKKNVILIRWKFC